MKKMILPVRMSRSLLCAVGLVFGATAFSTTAWAGRPLAVDDANTNDAGAGHVEVWAARAPGSTVLNVAPAFAPVDGLEFAITLSRDTSAKLNARALQLKWRITPSREDGCNLGTSLGASSANDGGGHQKFLNGLVSCNFSGQGSAHVNLGLNKPSDAASVRTWGVAYERELGAVTPHIEFFGAKGTKPTTQIGVRGKLSDAWQMDGTVGRSDGDMLYSLGVKFQF